MWVWPGGVRREAGGIYGIGDDGHHAWLQSCSEHSVLLAGVGHADHVVDVRQHHLQELVGEDGAAVSKPKEGVVSEDGGQAHGAGMQDAFMAQRTECPVAMHQSDAFLHQDLSQDGEGRQQGRQGHLVVEGLHGQVVHLHRDMHVDRSHACMLMACDVHVDRSHASYFYLEVVWEVTHSSSVAIGMCHHHHLYCTHHM